MAFPHDVPIIDTMIGFPAPGTSQYDFIRRQLKDDESKAFAFPAQYMFKDVPHDLPTDDPVSVTLHEMDRFGVEKGMIGCQDETSAKALKHFPDRFVPCSNVADPNDVVGTVRALVRDYEQFGVKALGAFPAGTFPQVAINDKKMYPVYAKCVELGRQDE